jgi:hypothetical protein
MPLQEGSAPTPGNRACVGMWWRRCGLGRYRETGYASRCYKVPASVKRRVGPFELGGLHTVNHPGKRKGYEDGIEENRQDDPRNPPHDVRPGATSSLWSSSASIQCLHFAYRRKRRVPRRKKLWFGSQTESGAKRVPLPRPRTGAGVHGAAAQQDRTEETRSSRRAGSSLVVLAAAREPTRQESVVAVRGA